MVRTKYNRPQGHKKKAKTMKKLNGATTKLERNVQAWVNRKAQDYNNGAEGVLKDLTYGGCSSGMVAHLVYTRDCVKFYRKHKTEIAGLLKETCDAIGEHDLSKVFSNSQCMAWDESDPLAFEDGNQNILAWFGFEEVSRILAERNGIEI